MTFCTIKKLPLDHISVIYAVLMIVVSACANWHVVAQGGQHGSVTDCEFQKGGFQYYWKHKKGWGGGGVGRGEGLWELGSLASEKKFTKHFKGFKNHFHGVFANQYWKYSW